MMNANIILVTGSTDGIGKQIAQKLARKEARVLLHEHNPSQGQGVMDEIRSVTGSGRLKDTRVTANCLHPGTIKTKLLRASFGDHPGDTPEKGAETSVYLSCSPEVKDVTGRYFEKCKPVCALHPSATTRSCKRSSGGSVKS